MANNLDALAGEELSSSDRSYENLDTNLRFVLAGAASPGDPYATELLRHQSERIRFLDYVSSEAFEELVTNATIFALPLDLEGLSLALLEAMGAGICLLAGDVPENRELVDGASFF